VRITGGGLGPDQSPLAYHQKGYSTTASL